MSFIHVADGFSNDCDEFLRQCKKVKTLTYRAFCEIWKDMKFSYIYEGRSSHSEIAELSEEVIQIAKQYMVANNSNYEESIAGLFLVYALLNLQPYPGFAPLRIVPDDVPAINRIELVARRERRHDVLYILGLILIQGPCQYHVDSRERGMEHGYKKYFDAGQDWRDGRPKGVFYRQNIELDLLREINSISQNYEKSKDVVKKGAEESDCNINFANPNLANELDSSLKKIINGIVESKLTTNANEISDNHSFARQSIKEKAMRETVGKMRHLIPVGNRKEELMSSPNKEQNGEAGKNNNKKQIGPKGRKRACKRKKLVKTKHKRKKNRKGSSSSSNSDIDVDELSLSNSEDDLIMDDTVSNDSSENNDLRQEKNSRLEDTADELNTTNPKENETSTIMSSDGQNCIEIEIIDETEDGAIKAEGEEENNIIAQDEDFIYVALPVLFDAAEDI